LKGLTRADKFIDGIPPRGSRHTKGVAEDSKGLKPTDCDCWWVGEASASLHLEVSLAMWDFRLTLAETRGWTSLSDHLNY